MTLDYFINKTIQDVEKEEKLVEEIEKETSQKSNNLNETQVNLIAESLLRFFNDITDNLKDNLIEQWMIFRFLDKQRKTRMKAEESLIEFTKHKIGTNWSDVEKASLRLMNIIYNRRYRVNNLLKLSQLNKFTYNHMPSLSYIVKKHIRSIITELPNTPEFVAECKQKDISVEQFKLAPEKFDKIEEPNKTQEITKPTPAPTKTKRGRRRCSSALPKRNSTQTNTRRSLSPQPRKYSPELPTIAD
jgi:hypothetical protein